MCGMRASKLALAASGGSELYSGGEGGREPKQPFQTEREKHAF